MKYLDYEGLQAYDNSIKNYINNYVPDLAQAANLATALKNAASPNSSVKVAVCTQAEYSALESYEENVIYIITDDTSGIVYTYANPVLDGTETVLTGITIQGIKYAIPQGTEVTANPTLDGNETQLTGLQIGNTRYVVGGGDTLYEHNINLADGTFANIFFTVIMNTNTPITKSNISSLLGGHKICATGYSYVVGDKALISAISISGSYLGIDGYYITATTDGSTVTISYNHRTNTQHNLSDLTFNDVVRQIN